MPQHFITEIWSVFFLTFELNAFPDANDNSPMSQVARTTAFIDPNRQAIKSDDKFFTYIIAC